MSAGSEPTMYSSQRLQVDRPTASITASSATTASISRRPCACAASCSRTAIGACRWLVPTSSRCTGSGIARSPLEQAGDLVELALEPAQLGIEDGDVGKRDNPDQTVDRGDVLDRSL